MNAGAELAHQDVTRDDGLTVENLGHIFTSRCTKSYYPVRTLTFAVDHEIWGLHPGGFKLTNGLIHLGNVFLVFWLNLKTLLWPTELAVHYAWPVPDSFLEADVILGGISLGVASSLVEDGSVG